MRLLVFSASPRKCGNTETLLDELIKGIIESGDEGIEIEKFRTHELDIEPCTGCGACDTSERCVIDDSFQNLFDLLIACDGVVFAAPLYFMNVPARGKALIDRCQVFWAAKHRRKVDLFGGRTRPGMLIACSGARHGPGESPVFRGFEDTMTYVFDALALELIERLLFSGIDAGEDAANFASVGNQVYRAGARMAKLLRGT